MIIINKFISILRKLKYIPGMKRLLLPIYKSFSKQLRNIRFRIFGLRVMRDFDQLMVENGYHYSIFAGTLLGAVREGGPLKHDLDLDTIMFNKDYSPEIEKKLIEGGFRPVRRFLVDNGELAREETYIKHGVTIDIYYAYSDSDFETYQCDFLGFNGIDNITSMKLYGYVGVRRLELPISYEVKRIPFGNITVNALVNSEEWLKARYGKDYMIPNPHFHDKGDNPHIFEWQGVKGELRMYYD